MQPVLNICAKPLRGYICNRALAGQSPIRQQAGLIIADVKGHEADTRDAIYSALEDEPERAGKRDTQ